MIFYRTGQSWFPRKLDSLEPGKLVLISLHDWSSKAQPLLLTLDQGYLLTTTLSDLEGGIAPLGPPVPAQPLLLGGGVAPPGHHQIITPS